MEALEGLGATVSYKAPQASGESNLAKVTQLLQSDTKGKIALKKGDSSFLIYRFTDENAANEYLSMKGEELAADVWINNSNKAMDNWLRMMGKPTMGYWRRWLQERELPEDGERLRDGQVHLP